jgi:hypothetical protein
LRVGFREKYMVVFRDKGGGREGGIEGEGRRERCRE